MPTPSAPSPAVPKHTFPCPGALQSSAVLTRGMNPAVLIPRHHASRVLAPQLLSVCDPMEEADLCSLQQLCHLPLYPMDVHLSSPRLWYWFTFSSSCSILGFLLPWTWVISSWLLLTLDEVTPPDLECGVAPLCPPAHAAAAPQMCGSSSRPPPLTSDIG